MQQQKPIIEFDHELSNLHFNNSFKVIFHDVLLPPIGYIFNKNIIYTINCQVYFKFK